MKKVNLKKMEASLSIRRADYGDGRFNLREISHALLVSDS